MGHLYHIFWLRLSDHPGRGGGNTVKARGREDWAKTASSGYDRVTVLMYSQQQWGAGVIAGTAASSISQKSRMRLGLGV